MERCKELTARALKLISKVETRYHRGKISREQRNDRIRWIGQAHYRQQHRAGATAFPQNT